ncbi:MAG TPA: hypothetical protein VFU86_19665 [Terriglobales bacterium]|nr:hypothetical protein [Terriglobales bacterium]
MKTLYVCVLALLMTVPVFASAKPDKANVNFDTTTIVAGKKLAPGKYQLQWNGNGPTVKVNFLRNDKLVATAPAKIIAKNNPYDNAVESEPQGKARILVAIDRSHMTLRFSPTTSKTASE